MVSVVTCDEASLKSLRIFVAVTVRSSNSMQLSLVHQLKKKKLLNILFQINLNSFGIKIHEVQLVGCSGTGFAIRVHLLVVSNNDEKMLECSSHVCPSTQYLDRCNCMQVSAVVISFSALDMSRDSVYVIFIYRCRVVINSIIFVDI